MTPAVRAGAVLAGGIAAAHLLPSVLTVPRLHRRLVPALSGRSPSSHVALTFDDGPDPASTPAVLDTLDELDVRATFFVLGAQVAAHPELTRQLGERGHEIAVHGWAHVPHLLRTPWGIRADVVRTCTAIRTVTGGDPRFWRPPNGVLTGAGVAAARQAGLRPVLWTADGQDWQARATPQSVLARVSAQLGPGGTVLLHDSDITSAPGSWRATVGALPGIVRLCREAGWTVGPLRDHWPATVPAADRAS